jgi:hypothetical protein
MKSAINRTATLACLASWPVTAFLASGIIGPDIQARHRTASFNEGCAPGG